MFPNAVRSAASRCALPLALALFATTLAEAQTIGADFAGSYTLTDLGAAPGVPTFTGGVNIAVGDASTLLISGAANTANGAVYAIEVTRDANNHITGFVGSGSLVSTAPSVDGGLAYGPNDVLLFTTFPSNMLGQIRPGSSTPDKMVDLTAAGVSISTGGLAIVPPGFAGAGSLKIQSFSTGGWYDAALVPDGSGTFDVQNVALRVTVGSGPEGAAYVKGGQPEFSADSVLVTQYGLGAVGAYEVDGDGDPILATQRTFVSAAGTIEGAFVDPLSGDFLFTQYSTGSVYRVSGFSPPPPPAYCVAKTNSCGTLPSIGSSGIASATASSGFVVSASNAKALKVGLLLYTNDGRGNLPFNGGTLCIDPSPLKRTTVVADGAGTPGQCDGTLSIDMNAFASGALGGNPLPQLNEVGTRINCQFWARDTIANGALLSDGLEYFVGV